MSKFKNLDPLLHSQLRLAIMSLLIQENEADFIYVKETTNATSGNLSIQIKKLSESGYIKVRKSFKNNYQNTSLRITPKGIAAFEKYVDDIKQYLNT